MEREEIDSDRRRVIGGLSAGLAAVVSVPALAQQDVKSGSSMADPIPDQNPLTAYPKPPFPRQQQEWPGLASQMIPRPDHGETSYKGSGRLAGRKALVTGGDSGIGRSVAVLFAREGADVAVAYLNEHDDAEETKRAVEKEGRRCILLPGDAANPAFCREAVDQTVKAFGKLDILVNNAAFQEHVNKFEDLTE